jgi:hypothetical protein
MCHKLLLWVETESPSINHCNLCCLSTLVFKTAFFLLVSKMSLQCNGQMAHNFHSVAGQPNQQGPGAYENSNFSPNAPNAARNPAIQNPITFQQSATSMSQQQGPQHQGPQPGNNQQMSATINTQPNYSSLTSQNQVCSDQYYPSHPSGQQDVPGSPSANSRNVQPYQMNARWAAPMPRTESNVSCQNELLVLISLSQWG